MTGNAPQKRARDRLSSALGVTRAFPWQHALLDAMLEGRLPPALDIPTGLGKTAVMAIWLLARAAGAKVPRRLVYVVDRRAVVDQASEVAMRLREFVANDPALGHELGLTSKLPISTLRGQFFDNREWLQDPSRPAIVLGTIDMIGSRLLFEGYSVSRRMRPYHAGLLACDTLVALDEAHLVPAFERLIEAVERDGSTDVLGPADPASGSLVPKFSLLSLSATGRDRPGTMRLTPQDREDPEVIRRMSAAKHIRITEEVAERDLPLRLADEAWAISDEGGRAVRCIIFCNSRNAAQKVDAALRSRGATDVCLFVGARRGWERQQVAEWLAHHGFIAGSRAPVESASFVIATSAGEVGVDLDAEHMVADVVAWERMVQRLGRVNRRGKGEARVVVVPSKQEDAELAARAGAVLELVGRLPRADGSFDGSPAAIVALKSRRADDPEVDALVSRASTPDPLHPTLTRPLLDSWAMTSLHEHSARPPIEPWLRGWVDEDEPQTTLIWRELLPLDAGGKPLGKNDVEAFFDAAAPHLAERLETETSRVVAWLIARADELAPRGKPRTPESWPQATDVIAFVLDDGRATRALHLAELFGHRKALEGDISGCVICVDARLGGLTQGLLDETASLADDVSVLSSQTGVAVVPFRVSRSTRLDQDDGWRTELRLVTKRTAADEEEEWIFVESRIDTAAQTEEGRSGAGRAQTLAEHQSWTERAARDIAARVALTPEYVEMLAIAARLHDEGKCERAWQAAFRAPSEGGPYAKTRGRPDLRRLAGYRHELGSIPRAERDDAVRALAPELRDLCLHLIAAHHGNARPLLRSDGADGPPSVLEARVQQVALRFARLQHRWGPWGLAWWEALLRAADQQASRQNDEEGHGHG